MCVCINIYIYIFAEDFCNALLFLTTLRKYLCRSFGSASYETSEKRELETVILKYS